MTKPAFTALASRANHAAREAALDIARTLPDDLDASEILNAIASGFLAHAVEVHVRARLTVELDRKKARKALLAEVEDYFRQVSPGAHLAVAMAKGTS